MAKTKKFASDAVVEIGQKLHPRRYRRFKDLRPPGEVGQWAKTLDWRSNPYDRFLLRREILHHLESTVVYQSHKNVFAFASRAEIEAEVDRLINVYAEHMDNYAGLPRAYPPDRVFGFALGGLPRVLAIKHRRIPVCENCRREYKLDTSRAGGSWRGIASGRLFGRFDP